MEVLTLINSIFFYNLCDFNQMEMKCDLKLFLS